MVATGADNKAASSAEGIIHAIAIPSARVALAFIDWQGWADARERLMRGPAAGHQQGELEHHVQQHAALDGVAHIGDEEHQRKERNRHPAEQASVRVRRLHGASSATRRAAASASGQRV
jgi:hypothetical protein